MGAHVDVPEVNIRRQLEANKNPKQQLMQMFYFTGVTDQTDFVMPSGWKPIMVFDAGLLQKEGVSDEYTLVLDVSTCTVAFAVAPANGSDIAVQAGVWL